VVFLSPCAAGICVRGDRAVSSELTGKIYVVASRLALCEGWVPGRKFIGGGFGRSDLHNVGTLCHLRRWPSELAMGLIYLQMASSYTF
jgi:hypothetical protein